MSRFNAIHPCYLAGFLILGCVGEVVKIKALRNLYANFDELRNKPQNFFPLLIADLFSSEFEMMDNIIELWGWEAIDEYASILLSDNELTAGLLIPNDNNSGKLLEVQERNKLNISTIYILQIFMSLNNALEVEDASCKCLFLLEAKDFMSRVIGTGFSVTNSLVASPLKKYWEKIEKQKILSSQGGKSGRYKERDTFKAAYVKAREHAEIRLATINKIHKRHTFSKLEVTTLERWAVDADKETGFKRRSGRPRSHK